MRASDRRPPTWKWMWRSGRSYAPADQLTSPPANSTCWNICLPTWDAWSRGKCWHATSGRKPPARRRSTMSSMRKWYACAASSMASLSENSCTRWRRRRLRAAGRRRAVMRLRPRHLRSRLTLWYVSGLATLLILAWGGTCALLFWQLRSQLDRFDVEELETVRGTVLLHPARAASIAGRLSQPPRIQGCDRTLSGSAVPPGFGAFAKRPAPWPPTWRNAFSRRRRRRILRAIRVSIRWNPHARRKPGTLPGSSPAHSPRSQ